MWRKAEGQIIVLPLGELNMNLFQNMQSTCQASWLSWEGKQIFEALFLLKAANWFFFFPSFPILSLFLLPTNSFKARKWHCKTPKWCWGCSGADRLCLFKLWVLFSPCQHPINLSRCQTWEEKSLWNSVFLPFNWRLESFYCVISAQAQNTLVTWTVRVVIKEKKKKKGILGHCENAEDWNSTLSICVSLQYVQAGHC